MPEEASSAAPGPADPSLVVAVAEAARAWDGGRCGDSLWRGDEALWTASGEGRWLGWLVPGAGWTGAAESLCSRLATACETVVVLGMGGSILGARMLVASSRLAEGAPRMVFLDSIDPDEVERVAATLDLDACGFVVASKSGTTLETRVLADLFWERMNRRLGDEAGARFLAVGDPGSDLDGLVRERSWSGVVAGVESIGGRYSALSPFGLVPLALAGGDPAAVVSEARAMAERCRSAGPAMENPGVALGLILGAAASRGFDKLALGREAPYRGLEDWIEQLLAESTGKAGRGILPVRQVAGDRLRHLGVAWKDDESGRGGVDLFGSPPAIGLPVEALGAEIFRWQLATAVAGSRLGVYPFVQPGVESAKRRAREILAAPRVERLPERLPVAERNGLRLWAGDSLAASSPADRDPAVWLRDLLGSVPDGGFLALLAWMDSGGSGAAAIHRLAEVLRSGTGLATSVGFGPRYLHSTGQFFKAGPADGAFVFVTREAAPGATIPGRAFDLATLEEAQARADFEVLSELGRPTILVRVEGDVDAGLELLEESLRRALETP